MEAEDIERFNRAMINRAVDIETLKKDNKKLTALAERYRQREYRNRKKVEMYKEKFLSIKSELRKLLALAGRFAKKPKVEAKAETLEERMTRVYGPLKEG